MVGSAEASRGAASASAGAGGALPRRITPHPCVAGQAAAAAREAAAPTVSTARCAGGAASLPRRCLLPVGWA